MIQSMTSLSPKNLILITNHFPYGTGEAFLENEIPYLVRSFDKVVILTRNINTSTQPVKALNFSHERIDPESNFVEIVRTAGLSLFHFKTITSYFRNEIRNLKSRGGVSSKKRSILLHDLFKALALSFLITQAIKTNKLTGTVIIYSFWFTSSALATLFVKPKNIIIKRISRAHRADLYESVQPTGYLSFREVLAQGLDGIFAVSGHGLEHLKNSVAPKWHYKLHLSRLGTRKPESLPSPKPVGLLLVSCSTLKPVKRVHLIIEALSLVQSLDITWIHFGYGELQAELEALIVEKLSSKKNIHPRIHGAIANHELFQFYMHNYVDLFINTSSSEGLPVSIMEAQSFGIPTVAMDVGGVSEIVSAETGRLLHPDDSPQQIAKAISDLLSLPKEQKERLRKNVLNNWENHYNAEKNYPDFIRQIQNS
jgi:colanic acid/amylovoran biosynthesis glycosyltransferase